MAIQERLEQLESELLNDIEEIRESTGSNVVDMDEIEVRPNKKDVALRLILATALEKCRQYFNADILACHIVKKS